MPADPDQRPALRLARLRSYLYQAGLPLAGPLRAELITTGRSNLTYLISDEQSQWILRRPPIGHILATAHDMGREFTVLSALVETAVPVPRPWHFCDNPAVLGVPFLVMDYVPGLVLSDGQAATMLSAGQAHDCSAALVDTLVVLHQLKPDEVGLAQLGRGKGFMHRQVRRWRRQWEKSTVEHRADLDRLADLLTANIPGDSRVSVVHGDYRLGNVILDAMDPGRIAAVIDWEMATLGDPLADLGLLLAYWHRASALVTAGGYLVGANPGFLNAEELARRYLHSAGADPARLPFYRAFGFFKLAVIAQTIVARHRLGTAVGEDLDQVPRAVDSLIAAGLATADDAGLRS